MSSNPLADLARGLHALAIDVADVVPSDRPLSQASPAQCELAAQTSGTSGLWLESAKSVVPVVTLLAQSTSQHLQALELLIPAEGIIYPLATVIRGVLEQSLVASYLADPNVDGNVRVRRYLNYRIEGLKERRALHNDAGQASEAGSVDDRIEAICRCAEDLGHTVHRPKGRPPYIVEPFPTTLKLAQSLIGTDTTITAEVSWRMLSATAHGALPGLAQHVSVIRPRDDEPSMFDGEIGASAAEIALWIAPAFLAVVTMLDRLRWLTGTPRDRSLAEVNFRGIIERVADLPSPQRV